MRLLSLHRSLRGAALTLLGENKTESSEGKPTASVSKRDFLLGGQPGTRRLVSVKPYREISPITMYNRAGDPPHEYDGNFPPQSWHETGAATNDVNGCTRVFAISQC